jgi:predicted kinase
MEKKLYLIRGICGSGKSTFAKSLGISHVEADMYFVDSETGEYKFDATKLKDAHEFCRKKTELWMNKSLDIAISNTFTQEWEMEGYYDLAKKYGYKVFSIIVENRHNGINEHNVPEETINKMKARFNIKL